MPLSLSVLANTTDTLHAFKELVEWADTLHLAYAWVSSSRGNAEHWRVLPLTKVARAIIGIQFAQTEPYALRQLLLHSAQAVKIIEDTEGVFHPKVVIGIRGIDAMVILGSSNLTVGGFGGNTEINVCIQGAIDDQPIRGILDFIDRAWTSVRAFSPDLEWLARYEQAYAQRPKPPRVPRKQDAAPFIVEVANDLDVEWADYFNLIARQERRLLAGGLEIHVFDHPDGSYLQEADNCREVFWQYHSFNAMPPDSRKLVAGFAGGTSGYFGRMTGAGYFKQIVNTEPLLIAEALDRIPLEGDDLRSSAEVYLQSVLKLRGISLGTATRLLTVKRPDHFLTLNNANVQRIREVFGFAPSTIPSYLQLHDQIWSFPWFQAPQPDGVDEQRVWYARVALLDAVLYEPVLEY